MQQPVIIYGIGELGGVFAKGLLKTGYPIYPVTRQHSIKTYVDHIDPAFILMAVGETALDQALETIPPQWKDRLVLIQNELLPHNWQAHALINPTVMSVWFEKKPGMDTKVVQSSPVYGSQSEALIAAL